MIYFIMNWKICHISMGMGDFPNMISLALTFSYAVKGNLQTFPSPTDIEMQDSKNSIGLKARSYHADDIIIIIAILSS